MINKNYSFKNFTNQNLKDVDVNELNNTEIYGSCFYQPNQPNSDIFPTGMIGVTFTRCNLDNVNVPVGNTVQGCCTNKRIKQRHLDKLDWIVDENLNWISKLRVSDQQIGEL